MRPHFASCLGLGVHFPRVATFRLIDFEALVRDFLAGRKQWNDVHHFVVESEWRGETEFPPGSDDALKDLYLAFLADSEDDSQFLPTKVEIRKLLERLQGAREQ